MNFGMALDELDVELELMLTPTHLTDLQVIEEECLLSVPLGLDRRSEQRHCRAVSYRFLRSEVVGETLTGSQTGQQDHLDDSFGLDELMGSVRRVLDSRVELVENHSRLGWSVAFDGLGSTLQIPVQAYEVRPRFEQGPK